jgi:hypothetical protein
MGWVPSARGSDGRGSVSLVRSACNNFRLTDTGLRGGSAPVYCAVLFLVVVALGAFSPLGVAAFASATFVLAAADGTAACVSTVVSAPAAPEAAAAYAAAAMCTMVYGAVAAAASSAAALDISISATSVAISASASVVVAVAAAASSASRMAST